MKLLLHSCCAPCSVSVVSCLREEGVEPGLFWYNPNIHPFSEYASRRDCLAGYAKSENLRLMMTDENNHDEFAKTAYSCGGKKNARCEFCYRTRLEKTASVAAKEGFDSFSTTLLVSPYQDHEAVKLVGSEVAAKYAVGFFYRDFRPLFRAGQSLAREMKFYMQKYCGCEFSKEERG